MVEYGEIEGLANMLVARRKAGKKTKREIREECGVSETAMDGWEQLFHLPEKEILPVIAVAYGIDLSALTRAWEISLAARKRRIEARKAKKPPKSYPHEAQIAEMNRVSGFGYRRL